MSSFPLSEVEKVHVQVKWALPAAPIAVQVKLSSLRKLSHPELRVRRFSLSANVHRNYFWSCGLSFLSGRGGRARTDELTG